MPWLLFGLVLLLWELSARVGWLSMLFFPPPTRVAQRVATELTDGTLTTAVAYTLARLGAGFALGSVAGLLLGVGLGWSRPLRQIVDPFIAAFHPIPKVAILPLMLIIFGIGETAKILLVAITAFFPVVLNTMTGVRHINPLHLDIARHYGATGVLLLRRVVIPAALPLILVGLRLALNAALIVTIAVELLASQTGLGANIWFAWQTLRTESLYVALMTTAVIGILFNQLLLRIEHQVVPK